MMEHLINKKTKGSGMELILSYCYIVTSHASDAKNRYRPTFHLHTPSPNHFARDGQCAIPQVEQRRTTVRLCFLFILDRENEKRDACCGYGDARKSQYHKAIPSGWTFHIIYGIPHKTTDHHSTSNAKCRPSPRLIFFMLFPFRR